VRGGTLRSLTLAGQAGLVVVGALVALAAVALADGDGPLGWVAVAGAAACASGLVFGMTQRAVPALALAAVAAAALTIAATAGDEPGRERVGRAFPRERLPERGAVASETRSSGNASETEPVQPAARRPTPAQFVRGYYAAIDAGRYEEAWSRLSARDDPQSLAFDAWRAGYATTVGHRVEDLRTEPDGVVRYVLVAVDRTPCGTTTERRFEVRWRLVRTGRSFTATSLGAVKLEGLDPVAAC
jgi:hypothetical protein